MSSLRLCGYPRCGEVARWRVGHRAALWLGAHVCDAHVGDVRREGDAVEMIPPVVSVRSWSAQVRRAVGSALFWSVVVILSPALLALWLLYLGEGHGR